MQNERTCCETRGINCNQGRDCPADNVIQFQSRNTLHRWFIEEEEDQQHGMTFGQAFEFIAYIAVVWLAFVAFSYLVFV